ncbi:MAG: TIM barrel protein [Proteobacteria bacterium]|nr:TIM barrel protein [Pseudomonadota bacterium]
MPKLAANITTMFQEFDLQARFQAAADCGFKAVEILFPYQWPAGILRECLDSSGLQLILINTGRRNMPPGEAGLAALPGQEAAFRESFHLALDYARTLGVPMIHVMAGQVQPDDSSARQTFIGNLQWAADLSRADGLVLNLEPLNDRDMPGYLHSRCHEVAALIDDIGRDNVRLQFDLYHQQMMEGRIIETLDRYRHLISHVQFSSVPGRHEPQYGEVNVHRVLQHLDDTGYQGWVGCE